MRWTVVRVSLLLTAVMLLAVPAASLHAASGAPTGAGDGDVDAIIKALTKMNEKIDALLAQKGPLKGDAVDKEVRALKNLKREVVKSFPDVYGIPFVHVYDSLEEIDTSLRTKPPLIGMAKRAVKELDQELRKQGKGVAKGVLDGVAELEKAIDDTYGDLKTLKEDELVKRAHELEAQKKKLLVYEFPKLFGHGFWRMYSALEDIDTALENAGFGTPPGDRRKALERAKKRKEELLSFFQVPCKEAKRATAKPKLPRPCPKHFTLGRDPVRAEGVFANGQGGCTPKTTFEEQFVFLAPGNGTLAITEPSTGNRVSGTIGNDGRFTARSELESYAGRIVGSAATARYSAFFQGGCTETWDAHFTLEKPGRLA